MIPQPHQDWVQQLLGHPAPEESRSTCHSCPVSGPGKPFRAELKCCGFVPELPNFQAGALLDVPSVQARIAEGVMVGPRGLGRSPAYAARSSQTAFGRDQELACPHLVDEGCSIWARREAVCASWFCRIDGGEAGQHFWEELRRTLRVLEGRLAAHCAEGLDWPGLGPEAFYRACAEKAGSTSWKKLRTLGGFELRHRSRELRAADRARLEAVSTPIG